MYLFISNSMVLKETFKSFMMDVTLVIGLIKLSKSGISQMTLRKLNKTKNGHLLDFL
jgi:hypothetical protein